jgi:hypothetical protein
VILGCGEAGGGEKLSTWCPHDEQRKNEEDEEMKVKGEELRSRG